MARKILLIDDERSVTSLVQRVGRALGMEVLSVLDPIEAVDAFIDFRPDMVLLDMVMPEKDGIDVLDEILLSGVPTTVVLLSNLSDAYLRIAQGVARFHGAPELPVLRKPFQRHELAIMLRTMLPG